MQLHIVVVDLGDGDGVVGHLSARHAFIENGKRWPNVKRLNGRGSLVRFAVGPLQLSWPMKPENK